MRWYYTLDSIFDASFFFEVALDPKLLNQGPLKLQIYYMDDDYLHLEKATPEERNTPSDDYDLDDYGFIYRKWKEND